MKQITATVRRAAGWRPGNLARNAFRGGVGYAARLGFQALYFLILARALGPQNLGIFSGIWVLCGLAAALSGCGFPTLAFRASALQVPNVPLYAGRGLAAVAITAPPLIATLLLLVHGQIAASPALPTLLLLAVSEVAFAPVLTLMASIHQGGERLGRTHLIPWTLWAGRTAGLAALTGWGEVTLANVALIHFATTVLVTAVWFTIEASVIASPLRAGLPPKREWIRGASFAISGASVIAFTELNQTLVLAILGPSYAGLTAAAYKVAVLAGAPLTVLVQAISPRLMRASSDPVQFRRLMGSMIGWLTLCALGATGLVLLGSLLVPWVYGHPYAAATPIARELCWLPILTAIRLAASYVLVASSRQWVRMVGELCCLAFGLSSSIALLLAWGPAGAVAGILLSEGAAALALSFLALRGVLGRDRASL